MRRILGFFNGRRVEPLIEGQESLVCLSREELKSHMAIGVDRKG